MNNKNMPSVFCPVDCSASCIGAALGVVNCDISTAVAYTIPEPISMRVGVGKYRNAHIMGKSDKSFFVKTLGEKFTAAVSHNSTLIIRR